MSHTKKHKHKHIPSVTHVKDWHFKLVLNKTLRGVQTDQHCRTNAWEHVCKPKEQVLLAVCSYLTHWVSVLTGQVSILTDRSSWGCISVVICFKALLFQLCHQSEFLPSTPCEKSGLFISWIGPSLLQFAWISWNNTFLCFFQMTPWYTSICTVSVQHWYLQKVLYYPGFPGKAKMIVYRNIGREEILKLFKFLFCQIFCHSQLCIRWRPRKTNDTILSQSWDLRTKISKSIR